MSVLTCRLRFDLGASVLGLGVLCVFSMVVVCLPVSTSATDCLERLISKMTHYVLSRTSNSTYSLTHSVGMTECSVVESPLHNQNRTKTVSQN